MKKRLFWSLLLAAALLTGCGVTEPEPTEKTDIFSDRDYDTGYDESESAVIALNGDSAVCGSDAVRISGGTVTITDEGTYILSGALDDGMVIVDAEKTDKTHLVLDGAAVHSGTSAAIYIRRADKVFITLAPGSVNTLSGGDGFEAIDESNIDGVIFSKEDLTLNGSGSLTVTSPAGHGIVSKDSLTVTGGTYAISAASHGLAGKDDVSVTKAAFTITAGKDGVHAENEDAEGGFVHIESGEFTIDAGGDGVSASASMEILGGTFDIRSGGGSANAEKQTGNGWGGFGGGRPGGPMGGGTVSSGTVEDSVSGKGVKAAGDLTICGGAFTIDSADDAVHSNGNITVGGGEFEIASGDDGFHADDTLTVTAGTIRVTQSYEGLEGLHIAVSGGEITLTASDDGLNAAGGMDQSGFGGPGGGDRFGGGPGGMGGGNSDGSIAISGGVLRVTASGDGIDANGTLEISGGCTTVCGPAMGDTATLDYDVSAVITGGTFIGTGGAGMAQTFSDSGQGVIAVSVGNQSGGVPITLTDSGGGEVISHTPELPFGVVILSSPAIIQGEAYTITVGTASGTFTAN